MLVSDVLWFSVIYLRYIAILNRLSPWTYVFSAPSVYVCTYVLCSSFGIVVRSSIGTRPPSILLFTIEHID